MAVIISDISAWQYWRTPPFLRDAEVDPSRLPLPPRLLRERSNAREADRLVRSRVLTDLKGVSLPVWVLADGSCGERPNELTIVRKPPAHIGKEHLVDLGNSLFVLSPEATLCMLGRRFGVVAVAKAIFEACGIFSVLPSTDRLDLVVGDLVDQGVLTRESCAGAGPFGYSDEGGRPLGDRDRYGDPVCWTPSFDRFGAITNLWKRPPLTSVEHVREALGQADASRLGRKTARALKMARNGAASPAEVYAVMLLCSGAWNGGESWGCPDLNRRIVYSQPASELARASYCIADILWAEAMRILEVQGEAFHADSLGFRLASERTAALESMGYTVAEILYEQMANLEFFDTVLPSLAQKLGFSLQERTPAFLRRRDALHNELFGKPYEPLF